MYDIGQGVPRDYKAAVKWYELAANQGYAKAQYNLGVMYVIGEGVPKDNATTYMWWNIAASKGYPAARKKLDILEKKMSPAQIAEAQRMTREWVAKHKQ